MTIKLRGQADSAWNGRHSQAERLGLVEGVAQQAHGGDVDHGSVHGDRPQSARLGRVESGDQFAGLGDLLVCGAELLVGQGDLAGMDGPLAEEAEGVGEAGLLLVTVRVAEVGEGAIDGRDPGGAGRNGSAWCTNCSERRATAMRWSSAR